MFLQKTVSFLYFLFFIFLKTFISGYTITNAQEEQIFIQKSWVKKTVLWDSNKSMEDKK